VVEIALNLSMKLVFAIALPLFGIAMYAPFLIKLKHPNFNA